MIKVEHLKKVYGNREVFRDLSLTVNDGEVVGIIGPSGTGKSLLLRCMIMLENPTEGKIYLDDEEITAPDCNIDDVHKRIGMVFQNFNLFSRMSVVQNVMSGLVHLDNMHPQDAYEKSMKLLKSVGLADKAFLYPNRLSGGEKQRVAMARTLALEPEIILMDEPTSALDPIMSTEVSAVIRMLKSQGHTMVIATHEMELIRQVCTKVVFLLDGKVWEEGTPDKIFDNADREETRIFVQALRLLEFDVQSDDFDFIGMQTSILNFTYRNGVPETVVNKLLSITEEFVQMIIIQSKGSNIMNMSFAYDQKDGSIDASIRFSGPKLDPDNPIYFFSWPIIQMRADEITSEEISEDGFTNCVHLKLKR